MDALTPRRILTSRTCNKAQALLRSEAGSTTLEFALIIPVVLLLLFGSMSIMIGLLTYGNALYATGIAARYASVHGTNSDAPADAASVAAQVRTHLWLNSQGADVTSTWIGGNTPGSFITVDASTTVPLTLPFSDIHQLTIRASAARVITR